MFPSILFSFCGKYIFSSTKQKFSPLRTISFEKRPPQAKFNESIINVFPAPVSPVKTLNPVFKSTVRSSIIPIFFMCNVEIIINILSFTNICLYYITFLKKVKGIYIFL